jgi:hypothetical protein
MRNLMKFMPLLLVLVLGGGFLACSDPPKPAERLSPVPAQSTPQVRPLGDIPDLDLEMAMAKEDLPHKDAILRTLFAFEEDPAEVLRRRQRAEEEKRAREEAQKNAAEQARVVQQERQEQQKAAGPAPPPKPVPPPITFTFIGYFGYPDDRIGVFQGKTEEEQELAGEGDTIFGKYTVVELGYESVQIGFEGFAETERIPLAGGGGKK